MTLLVAQQLGLGLLGLVALLCVTVWKGHQSEGMWALLSLIAWGVLALRGGSVTVNTQTDGLVTIGSPVLQVVALAFAFVSLVAVYGAISKEAASNGVRA
ncbi:hypothetical protein SAMN04487947_0441 [Halogeometricum rufum]|uniref:Uncharacterized protein n=1 Tax=Halogeometricum rufum TaxID=553469 RepID=A0A1I6G229_9EURY|nr:hypothetical protein [Halogeometricum rufum]SFR36273.1 hypothetical protein SAMN04487947_0441 [Halogeometricum rufum]